MTMRTLARSLRRTLADLGMTALFSVLVILYCYTLWRYR
jgi:hypothetical protein